MTRPDKRALDVLAYYGFREVRTSAPDRRRWWRPRGRRVTQVVHCSDPRDVCRWLCFHRDIGHPVASSVTDGHFVLMLTLLCS